MRINKLEGALLSLMIMIPYVLLYRRFVQNIPLSFELTIFFFLGIFLHFYRKIEAGTRAELIFFEKSTGYFWEDGHSLVPSALPALHNIGIYLLWNLKKSVEAVRPDFNPNISVYHNRNQDKPEYKVNANASLTALTIHNFFGRMYSWFVSPFKDTSALKYQRLGFRIIVLALVIGFFGNVITGLYMWAKTYNPFQEESATVTLTVQLTDGAPHPFPERALFAEAGDNSKIIFHLIDGVPYIQYQRRTDGKPAYVEVEKSLCSIVPAGKIIRFNTKRAPIYAANMSETVVYVKKVEALNFFEQLWLRMFPEPGYRKIVTWKELQNNWNSVDTDNFLIATSAREQVELDDTGSKTVGGLVCF